MYDNEIDYAKILLFSGLFINFLALTFKYIGYLLYVWVSGKQYGFFDFMYLLLHAFSESAITALLIFVAFGWTITFLKGKDFDLYIPLRTTYFNFSRNVRSYKCDFDDAWKNQ